jgi:hypothetical protein
MPSKQMDNEIDNIILGIVHQAGLIPRGKTISADMFPEARAAIERMVGEGLLKELETLESNSDCLEDGCGLDADLLVHNLLRRITELKKRLTTPTEDKQND